MPLTDKGQKIKSAMIKQYGSDKGESVFYASANKGTITGVEKRNKGGLFRYPQYFQLIYISKPQPEFSATMTVSISGILNDFLSRRRRTLNTLVWSPENLLQARGYLTLRRP